MNRYITYLDLFSGTGGFAKGLLEAGFRFKKHYFSEIDTYASANYQYHFPAAEALGDITVINGKKISRPDIISFGSPCQDISLAGKRKGLKASRSKLFFEAIRLIKECHPGVFVFENVKGIFSSNKGKDFETVLQTFADIGLYDCQWQLLNTRWFLPQNRERFYLVGTLAKKGRCPVFPFGQGSEADFEGDKTSLQGQVCPTIDTSIGNLTNRSPYVLHVPEATVKGYSSAHEGDSINLSFLKSNKRRSRVGKKVANTLTSNVQFTLVKGRLRRLTPIECERLQGFPDEWTLYGLFGDQIKLIADGHRYKMLGNAVSVPVIRAIAKKIIHLFKPTTNKTLGNTSPLLPLKSYQYPETPEIVLGNIPESKVSSTLKKDCVLTDGQLLAGIEGFPSDILFSRSSDDWATPDNLFHALNKEFRFGLDVAASSHNAKCSKYFNRKENGLAKDWYQYSNGKSVYCNPPYGRTLVHWLKKAHLESQKGCTVVCLIPFRTDTRYFHQAVLGKAKEIRLIKGRLKYNDGKNSSPFPSAVIIYQKGQHKTRWVSCTKEGKALGEINVRKQQQSNFRYDATPEVVLGDVPDILVPEIQVSYSRDMGIPFLGKLNSMTDVESFVRKTFDSNTLELQEQFIVIYLDTQNNIIGYYRHSKGSINEVTVDIRIILGAAVQCGCTGLIITHNHPSGGLEPSKADLDITRKLREACTVHNIRLVDHLIITKSGYYSFASNGFLGLSGVESLMPKDQQFVTKVIEDLKRKTSHNKRSIEKLAAAFGITSKNEVKELTELAIVNRARELAHSPGTIKERFDKIVELYYSQVNLSHRTSQSILLQQYSTPAPIGYLAGVFCEIDKLQFKGGFAFEPSAGNGLLTIAAKPERVYVNEIDNTRNRNLRIQGFADVTGLDATKPFEGKQKRYQAVLTNPPFGDMEAKLYYETFGIKALEHVMALRALDTMASDGRAAIIIGGHTRWDDKGRVQAGKQRIFLNYLYSRYNVADIINIDGHKLYSRQGTAFDVRLILINGRKKTPFGNAPVYNAETDKEVNTFDGLFERVMDAVEYQPKNNTPYDNHVTLYEKLLALQPKYPKTILAIRKDEQYLVFGKDALLVQRLTDLKISVEFLYMGKGVVILRIPFHSINAYLQKLVSAGHRMALIDELTDPKDTDMKRMELEAEALILELELLNTLGEFPAVPGNIDKAMYQNYTYYKAGHYSRPNYLYLILNQRTGEYETYDLDAERINYIFSVPLTLFAIIKGKKVYGLSLTADQVTAFRKKLQETNYRLIQGKDPNLFTGVENEKEELGAPYIPASDACIVLNTEVPDSMAFETHEAVKFVRDKVGGDMDNFVRHRLHYPTKKALCRVLSAEQIDAVAMAIYNIEARGQGMIIGDQTGIGKGRIAASMIRYAVMQGLKPVFLTEKANLFSDIYRDLAAIGSAHLRPFIVNSRESKTDIKDEDGEIIYQAPPVTEQQSVIASREVPVSYDFVLATYTQFNSAEKKPEKPNFLRAIAPGNIFIMDEAHNSSGSSNTGEFMQGVIRDTKGVVFLSATFAKRPDNMPIYAMKTAIADCNMTKDDLVASITKGGVALQEVLSSQLVAEGQMMRRERSFEGVEVNYISLDEKAEEHKAISDNITQILRAIIAFQSTYIDKMVEEMDDIAVAEGKEVEVRDGTSQAGVDNLPYFSKVFQVINQMLFSLKAEAVAERTIARLKEGKKPVIAFASTMGSFIESMENEHGLPASDGDTINTDFSEVLRRGLDGIMRYTVKDIDGNPEYKRFELSELSKGAQDEYNRIMEKIMTVSTGISISPIDVIIKKLKEAGYTVAEVTGRKYEVQLSAKTSKGLVLSRKRINTNDAFRQFNNNEVDVLMINQSGSTGASAHAIPTAKVPADQVRQRVMIVLQAELDISTEVQKRGRINRTGQILKPIYDYVTSAIPAEKRLMMMLQKKLKSLDANTTSNQKQSTKILDVPDFLNKYGDKIVKEYLMENKDINDLLDDPLHLADAKEDSDARSNAMEDAAHRVSGRVAVLSTKMQEDFYNEIAERYNDFVEYMKQVGEYDLEVEAMNLEAETTGSRVIKMGKGSDSAFGDDSILETVKANVLKKPFSKSELANLINESLKGKEPKEIQQEYIRDYKTGIEERLAKEQADVHAKYDLLEVSIPAEKKIQKILDKEGEAAWHDAIEQRQRELDEAREAQLASIERTFENRRLYVVKTMEFFYPGRLLSYPVDSYDGGKESVPAVFLGLVIDKKKKNPYAPSAMKLRFAIANSSKYLAMPASYNEEILAIMGNSAGASQPEMNTLLQDWENYTKQNNVDRKTRHIITGNLLQAFSDFKGKLVSYTTDNNETKKGILLPENWNPGEQVQDKVVVPILKALPLIRSITQNGQVVTNNGISFFRKGDDYKIVVSASRSKGGDVYLDKDILALVENNNFEKTSTSMVAVLPAGNIDKLIEVLQTNHSCSVTVHSSQVRDLKMDTGGRYSNRKPILLPDEEKEEQQPDTTQILELEAEALALELELLAAA